MGDWKQKCYRPGTRVMVAVCTRKGRTRPFEPGILLSRYDSDSEDLQMPRIKIHSGRVVLGCECWWIPLAEIRPLPRSCRPSLSLSPADAREAQQLYHELCEDVAKGNPWGEGPAQPE